MDDTLQRYTAVGADFAIIALIYISLISGKPAFETFGAKAVAKTACLPPVSLTP